MINIMHMKLSVYLIVLALGLLSCEEKSDSSADEAMEALTSDSAISALLLTHNKYRSAVGVADLAWSDDLARSAQHWANALASNCDFDHSDSPYGENIWKGTSGAFTATNVVNSWGSEIENYNYTDNACEGVCGHYTQIVWGSTTAIGCAMSSCDGVDIWVCQYNPPGNFTGQKPY